MSNGDPRVSLTWGQFVWIIVTLTAVLLAWADNKVSMARMEMRISAIERSIGP